MACCSTILIQHNPFVCSISHSHTAPGHFPQNKTLFYWRKLPCNDFRSIRSQTLLLCVALTLSLLTLTCGERAESRYLAGPARSFSLTDVALLLQPDNSLIALVHRGFCILYPDGGRSETASIALVRYIELVTQHFVPALMINR